MAANRVEKEKGLEHLEDQRLVERVQRGDERSLEVLLNRYRLFARSKARSYFLTGADKEDVVQEGMIGLFKAIRDFDLSQETHFKSFAELCISRQILSAIKSANRNKHQPLNKSLSLDAPAFGDEKDYSVADTLMAPSITDPAELLISSEEIDAIRESMKDSLTDLEGDVLRLYMDGRSYEEIARVLGNHVKSIDNALQRIKRKLQRHLDQRKAQSS